MTIPTPPPTRPVQPRSTAGNEDSLAARLGQRQQPGTGLLRRAPIGGTAYVTDTGQLPDDSVLLEKARIVRLQPGDVVTVTLHYDTNEKERAIVLSQLKELFPDNKVAVFEGAELAVVRAEETDPA